MQEYRNMNGKPGAAALAFKAAGFDLLPVKSFPASRGDILIEVRKGTFLRRFDNGKR